MKKMGLILSMCVMSASALAESTVLQKVTGEDLFALYGVVDLDVANEFLKEQNLDLVAVNVNAANPDAPALALTGIGIDHIGKAEYPQQGLEDADYGWTYIPLLVRHDGSGKVGIVFMEPKTDSKLLLELFPSLGMSIFEGLFSRTESESFPFAGMSSSYSDLKSDLQSSLTLAPADEAEYGEPLSGDDVLQSVSISSMGGELYTQNFSISGTIYERPYDESKGDSYWVNPESLHGKLFEKGKFIPTQWRVMQDGAAVVYQPEKI